MDAAYRLFKYCLFRPGIRLLWHPKVAGKENVPADGAAIMACNHISAGDTLALPAMIDRQMAFPAKKEVFEGRDIKGRVVAWFLKLVGMVPMDRSGGRASAAALDQVHDILYEGRLLGIFPEGTRSPDGRLYKGKTGVARMALTTGVPVVPVGMVNTELHKGPFGFPIMKRAVIRIGRPLSFAGYLGRQDDREVLRWVTDEIMAAIQDLSGQDYVDVYAASVKSGNFTDDQLAARVAERPGIGLQRPADRPVAR